MNTPSSRYGEHEFFEWGDSQENPEQLRLEQPIARTRLRLFAAGTLAVLVVFGFRTFSLSVLRGEFFSKKAEAARERIYATLPLRGVIQDRNGETLTINEPAVVVFLDPLFFPKDKKESGDIFTTLSPLLKISPEELETLYATHANQAQLLELAAGIDAVSAVTISARNFPGIRVEKSFTRNVKDGTIFSPVIGYVGAPQGDAGDRAKDIPPGLKVGRTGIEAFYDLQLRGVPGQRMYIVDAQGNVRQEEAQQEPTSGLDVTLTVDAELSRQLYQALDKARRRVGVKAAAAVAIDPQNGEVLSLVSIPSVDVSKINHGLTQEEFSKLLEDKSWPFLNRAIAGIYPSGSTVKPFVATGALEEKVVSPSRRIFDTGAITVPSVYDPKIVYTFRDWKAHGSINIIDAIAVSANVYFYTVGGGYGDIAGLGPERLTKWLALFGFGKELGIDLESEAQGRLPTPEWKEATKNERWFIGDTYNLSIGQGDFAVTPLQMATATAAIANGGSLLRPYLVKEIHNSDGSHAQRFESQELRRIPASSSVLSLVRQGMRESVSTGHGTNRSMADLPIAVAAKTGTAQVGTKGPTHAWVTAFAPYKNPTITLAIVIEGGGEGTVATGVAKEVLAWYAQNRL